MRRSHVAVIVIVVVANIFSYTCQINHQTMSRPQPRKALSIPSRLLPHFHFRFEPHARPINCTTLPATTQIATDACHPLYTPIQRRLSSFDPHKLSWTVRVPTALSKKRVIRMWVTKRLREAFIAELKRNGYDRSGSLVPVQGALPRSTIPSQLSGAISLNANLSALTAPISEIRDGCTVFVQELIKQQARTPSYSFKRERS